MKALPGGSSGSYTHSAGIREIREEVVDFLHRRDDRPAHADNVFLTDGASPAVRARLARLKS